MAISLLLVCCQNDDDLPNVDSAPVFTEFVQDISSLPEQTFTVQATVIDPAGIKSVSLQYEPWFLNKTIQRDYVLDGDRVVTNFLSQFGNPNLQWETVEDINLGLNGALFNSAVNFSVEYYQKTSKDLLFYVELPNYTGIPGSVAQNVGSFQFRGWDSLEKQFKDLMVSAYTNEKGEITIVLINYKGQAKEIKVNQKDISLKDAYETSADKNLEHRQVKKNHLVVAPRSITTLTGTVAVKTNGS